MARILVEGLLVVVALGVGAVVENLYGPVKAVKDYWASHFGKPAGS